MGAYIVRRFIAMILMVVAMSMIVFLLFSALPADPARLTCGKACTPAVIEANRKRLGLDKPLHEQYTDFVTGIFAGRTYGSGTATFECNAPCLGYSFSKGEEVTDLISRSLPITLQLSLGAFVIWMLVGVTVGIIAALRRGKWQDRTIMGLALAGYSFPTFFIGLLLVFFVQIKWSVIGFDGYVSFFENPTGWFTGLILPWITLALIYAAFYARLTRNQMLETMGEDYIRTARAKGLPERTVVFKHAIRNALLPIITLLGLSLPGIFSGSVLVESIFAWPGMGRLIVGAIFSQDTPLIIACFFVFTLLVALGSLVADLLYAAVDPRIRLD